MKRENCRPKRRVNIGASSKARIIQLMTFSRMKEQFFEALDKITMKNLIETRKAKSNLNETTAVTKPDKKEGASWQKET